MKMFKTGGWIEEIQEVEVIKTSEKSVWYKDKYPNEKNVEKRELKHTSYYDFWETRQDAINHLIKKWSKLVDRREHQLNQAKRMLDRYSKLCV